MKDEVIMISKDSMRNDAEWQRFVAEIERDPVLQRSLCVQVGVRQEGFMLSLEKAQALLSGTLTAEYIAKNCA